MVLGASRRLQPNIFSQFVGFNLAATTDSTVSIALGSANYKACDFMMHTTAMVTGAGGSPGIISQARVSGSVSTTNSIEINQNYTGCWDQLVTSTQLSNGIFDNAGTSVIVKDARINGSNLEIVVRNVAATTKAVSFNIFVWAWS